MLTARCRRAQHELTWTLPCAPPQLQYGGLLSGRTVADADASLRRGGDWWRGWTGSNLVWLAQMQIFRGARSAVSP